VDASTREESAEEARPRSATFPYLCDLRSYCKAVTRQSQNTFTTQTVFVRLWATPSQRTEPRRAVMETQQDDPRTKSRRQRNLVRPNTDWTL